MPPTKVNFYALGSFLLLFFLGHLSDVSANIENAENRWRLDSDNEHENETEYHLKNFSNTWVSNLFYDVLWNFTISKNVGSLECQKQTNMYIRQLETNSLWAVQMSDSWSRYPIGMLVRNTHQLGVFDECVEVHSPVQGQYCLPQITLNPLDKVNYRVRDQKKLKKNDNAWHEILDEVVDDYHIVSRNPITFSICIPESCTASELEISLQKAFDKRFIPHQISAQVKVESMLCSTGKDTYPYDTGYYLTCVLIGLILLICCLSTLYHVIILLTQSSDGENTNRTLELCTSFSMIRNFQDLIKYDKDSNLNIFHFIKVIFTVSVLFAHTFNALFSSTKLHGKQNERLLKNEFNVLKTFWNLVDPFFYVLGFLMYYLLLPQFRKSTTSWFHIPMIFIYRYLKLLPSYVILILLTAFVIPHLGDGPLWAPRIWLQADTCRNYWWANLLLINNFLRLENQCLIVSWYVPCMMQLVAIGVIAIYVYAKNRNIGLYLLISLLCASLIIPFVMTYTHRVYGMILSVVSIIENPPMSEEFQYHYRQFYLRGTPLIVGLLTGIVVEELKKRQIRFSMLTVYVGIFANISCVYIVQKYGTLFFDVRRPYNVIEQSFYATISHCTWPLLLCWITICIFTSGVGPMEKYFNNRLMVSLGRLSYAVYLVNITIICMTLGRQRISFYSSVEVIMDQWIVATFKSYLIGLILHITVDAPFGLLIRRIFYGNILKNDVSTISSKVYTEPTEQRVSIQL